MKNIKIGCRFWAIVDGKEVPVQVQEASADGQLLVSVLLTGQLVMVALAEVGERYGW